MSIETILLLGVGCAVLFPALILIKSFADIRRSSRYLDAIRVEQFAQLLDEIGLSTSTSRALIPRIERQTFEGEWLNVVDEANTLSASLVAKNDFPNEISLSNSSRLVIRRTATIIPPSIDISISKGNNTASCRLHRPKGTLNWLNPPKNRVRWEGFVEHGNAKFIIAPSSVTWQRCHVLKDSHGKVVGASIQCIRSLEHRAAFVGKDVDPLIHWCLFYLGVYELGSNVSLK